MYEKIIKFTIYFINVRFFKTYSLTKANLFSVISIFR